MQRGELKHAENLVFEKDGQHHDVGRHGFTETRPDRDVAPGHLVDQDRLALDRRLPNEPLAEKDLCGALLAEPVSGDPSECWLLPAPIDAWRVVGKVERTELGGGQWSQLTHDQLCDVEQVTVTLHEARDSS